MKIGNTWWLMKKAKIWQQYKTGGIAAVAALLGIAWF